MKKMLLPDTGNVCTVCAAVTTAKTADSDNDTDLVNKNSQFICHPMELLVQREREKEVSDDEGEEKDEDRKEEGEEPKIEDVGEDGGEEIGFWENDIDWLYGTSEATRTADSEAVLDTQDAHPAAHETVEQVVEDVHGDANENEDPDTSRMGATNCSESAQATRNQSFSSNPEFGLPGSNLNTHIKTQWPK